MKKERITLILGVGILAYLIHTLNPKKTLEILVNTKISYFILALIINFFDELVAAKILHALIKRPDISFREVFLSHISGMLASDVTPAKIGYYYTAVSLSKKLDVKKSINMGVVTAIQGIVFLTKTIGCILGIGYFTYIIGKNISETTVLLAGIIPALGLASIIIFTYTRIPQKILSKTKVIKGIIQATTNMQDSVKKMSKKDYKTALSLTLLIWILNGIQWWILARSIGVELDLITALLMRPLITAIGFIPLTPNGLGLAEGGGAILFSAIGFTASQGLAFVMLTRINQTVINSLGLIDLRK